MKTEKELLKRIVVDPRVMVGKPVIKGTRIPVYLILGLLSAGYDFRRIMEAYPALREEDIKAAIEYASKIVKNEEIVEYAVSQIPAFLIDENISPLTVRFLRKLGYDVKDVAEAGLKGCGDQAVVELAVRENRIVVTHDLGFGGIYYFSRRGQFGVIVLRIHTPAIEEVNRVLGSFLKKVDLEREKLSRCLIIVDKRRYRVLR